MHPLRSLGLAAGLRSKAQRCRSQASPRGIIGLQRARLTCAEEGAESERCEQQRPPPVDNRHVGCGEGSRRCAPAGACRRVACTRVHYCALHDDGKKLVKDGLSVPDTVGRWQSSIPENCGRWWGCSCRGSSGGKAPLFSFCCVDKFYVKPQDGVQPRGLVRKRWV